MLEFCDRLQIRINLFLKYQIGCPAYGVDLPTPQYTAQRCVLPVSFPVDLLVIVANPSFAQRCVLPVFSPVDLLMS